MSSPLPFPISRGLPPAARGLALWHRERVTEQDREEQAQPYHGRRRNAEPASLGGQRRW